MEGHKKSVSQNDQSHGTSMLVIDGAYFQLGSRSLQQKTGFPLQLNEETISNFISYVETKIGKSLT
jgi:hypothetical protein